MMYGGMKVHDMKDERNRAKKWAGGNTEEPVSHDVFSSGIHIEVIKFIESIINNTNDIHVVNTLNRGAINNLPKDAIVGVPAVVGRYGIIPENVGCLPESLATVLRQYIRVQQLTVEAALNRDKKTALEAFLHDPQIKAEELLNELLQVHNDYLDNFKMDER